MTSLAMRRRSAPRICSSCPRSDSDSGGNGAARVDGYPRRCYRSTRIEILRKRRFDDRRPLEDEPLRRTYRCVDDRAGQNLARCPNMKPAATVQPKSVAESGERPRDISAVFDEHIDVHPARPGESLAGGCVENSR